MNIYDNLLAQMELEDYQGKLDRMIQPEPAKKSGALRRYVADPAISALKGAIGLPEAVVGIADIVTGGEAGQLAERGGFRPKEAKAILDDLYSPEQQEANRTVEEAEGFIPTIAESLKNPSTIVHSIIESAPSMLGGSGVARQAIKYVPKLAPVVAGALGEGVISAGATAEQTRQATEQGDLSLKQSAVSAASGALTSLFGLLGGKLAQRLGIADIDTLLAGGTAQGEKQNILRRLVEGAISEGAFEELPQSAQEQAAQNISLGKPWHEGVAEAAASGLMAGLAMGGAGGVLSGRGKDRIPGIEENLEPQTSNLTSGAIELDPFKDVGEPPHPVVDLESQEQPVLPETPKGPLSRAAEAAGATAIPGIGDIEAGPGTAIITPIQGQTTDELVLDEARGWADGEIKAGKSQLMQQVGETQSAYAQRILSAFKKSADVPVLNQDTTGPKYANVSLVNPETGVAEMVKPDEVMDRLRNGWREPDARTSHSDADMLDSVTDADRGLLQSARERAAYWERGSMDNGRSNKTELFPWLKDWGKTTPAEVAQAIGNFLEGKKLGEVQKQLVAESVKWERENRQSRGAAPIQGIGDLVAERRGMKGKIEDRGSRAEENLEPQASNLEPAVLKKAQLYAEKAGLDLEGWSNDDISDFVGKYESFVKGKSRAAQPIASIGEIIAQRRAMNQKNEVANAKTEPHGTEEVPGKTGATSTDNRAETAETVPPVQGVDGQPGGGVPVLQPADAVKNKIVERLNTHVDEETARKIADLIADEYAGKKALGPAWLGKRIKDGWIDKWKLQAQLKSGEKAPEDLTPEEIAALPGVTVDHPVVAALKEKGAESGSQQGKTEKTEEAEVGGVSEQALRVEIAKRGKNEVSPENGNVKEDPKARIEDFGEVLSGARKMYAQAYKDKMDVAKEKDIAAEPLSKSWPEPDYQKLLDDGADSWMVAFVRASRDEIPTKPKQSWKLKRWVAQVQLLRGVADQLLSGEMPKELLRSKLAEPEHIHVAQYVGGRAELYQAVGHERSLKGIRLISADYGFYKGQKYSPPKTMWSVEQNSKATAFSNFPSQLAVAETKDTAISEFKAKVATLDRNDKPTTEVRFDIFTRRGTDGFIIGKKIGKDYVDLKVMSDLKGARQYIAENKADLVKQLDKYKDIPNERKTVNSPRIGENYRNGEDVTPEMFAESFGFRGVQFGNYVEGARRQADLNEAYDALMDMAGVLGVPEQSLSLNGSLGLAFGARGKGGKNAPSAHFESSTVVINLTKGGGAGSLAHEFFHALDNYFARARNDKHGFLTEKPFERGEGVRPEMVQAFKEIMRTVNRIGMKERSQNLDKRRTKDYWSTGLEMAARAFESYIINKLADNSLSNDYLANVVSEQAYGLEEAYPYPTAGEMPDVRAAFDKFFSTIETKETDRGVAMFSVRPDNAVEILKLSGNEIKDGQLTWKEGYEFAREAFQGKSFINTDTGWMIDVSAKGMRKAFAFGASQEQIQSVAALDRLLETAVLVDSESHKGAENVKSHIFVAAVEIGGELFRAKVRVNDVEWGDARKYYGHEIEGIEIERPRISGRGLSAEAENRSLRQQDLSTINIADLLTGAKKNDGSPLAYNGKSKFAVADASYGLPAADIQTSFEPVYKNMPNSPPWRVVQTAAELPKRALDDAAKRGIPQRLLQAVYLGNEVVYVADNFRSIEEAKQVLLEEVVVHHGLRGIMAKGAYEKHMTQAALWYANKRNAEWKDLAEQYGMDLKTREGRIEAAEEMLGRDARTGMDSTILSKVIAAVKEFLRSVGLDLQYGDSEIRELLGKARRFVEGKEGPRNEDRGTGIDYGAMLRSLREQGVTDDQLEAFATWQPGGARYAMSDRQTPDRMTPTDLQKEIGGLKPRVEKAYEDNNLVLAERLDARLEGLYERLETSLLELEGENDAQSHHAAEENDVEVGLDEELATKYREAFVERGHSEYGVYATKSDAINAIRYVLKEHGSDKADAATDAQVLEVAKEAYDYRKNVVDRLNGSTRFALARLEDVKSQIVDKGVSLNTTEREVLEADKTKAIEAIETTVRDYDDPSRLLFRAFYESDQQQSPGVVPFNPDRGHFAAGEDLKGSWWTTSYATAQEIAWSKARDGRTVKIVALPVDKLPTGKVFIQNTNPPGFVYDLFVGLPADVLMADVQEMPVDTGIRYALADRFSGYVGEMKGGEAWTKIARMLNPLDWSRAKRWFADVTPQNIRNGAANFLRNPIFDAEADENKRPFVDTGIKREETKMEYLLRFFGFDGPAAEAPGLLERLKKTYSQWENSDRTTEWGRITDAFNKLPVADREGVDLLLYRGDLHGKVYKTLEMVKEDKKAAGVSDQAFAVYQKVRTHIDTVVADSIEDMSRQFMYDAGLPKELIEKHLSDYRNRLAERPGWLPRNHGEGDYQVNVYQVINGLKWDVRGDKDSMQALLPYFPSAEVAAELKKLTTRLGLKYQHLPNGGQLVTTYKNATAVFKKKIEKLQAKIATATTEEKKKLGKELDDLQHAKIMAESMPSEQMKRFQEKASEIIPKLQLENELLIERRKVALKQAIEDGEAPSTIKDHENELQKLGSGRIRVKVYMRLQRTESKAGQHHAEVEKDLKKAIPHNYLDWAQYETEHRFVDQLTEDMYGDMKNDFAMEQAQLEAINRASKTGEISKNEAAALRQKILQSTAEVLMARGAGAHRIRRAPYLIEGYDADNTINGYHDYMTGTAGMLSKARYAQEQFEHFRYAKPEVKKWAHKYIVDNLRNMGFADQVSGNMRAVATLTYLGFKVSSMLINSTQPWTLGIAELGRHTKRSAVWAIGKAQKDILSGKLSESDKRLFASEIFKLQEMATAVHEMSGQREGATGKISSFMHTLTDKALMPFQEVELLNRKTVILAAYRTFRADGLSRDESLQKALAVNRAVNFEMSRANLPGFAQKPLGRTVYALQSFMWNTWNWIFNRMTSGEKEDMKALLRYAVSTAIIGGAMALPGGDELDKLYQMFFGESPKLAFRKWTAKHAKEYGSLGEMLNGFAWHGAASAAGVNISNAIRLQIPIVSPLIGGESLPDAAGGVMTGLVQKGSRAAVAASRGDIYRTVENLSPEALAGAMRAYRMSTKGATSYSGKILFDENGRPMKYTGGEALKRTFGFQPSRVSERSDLMNIEYGLKAHWKEERSDLLAKLRMAAPGNERKEVMLKIMRFNKDLRASQASGLVPIIKAQTIKQALFAKPNKRKMAWEQEHLT